MLSVLRSRGRRTAACSLLLAVATPATALADSDSTLDLQCRFPIAGVQPVHMDLHATHPKASLDGGGSSVDGERVDITTSIPGLGGLSGAAGTLARLSARIDLTSHASGLSRDGARPALPGPPYLPLPGDWTDSGSGEATSPAINGAGPVPLRLTVPSVFRMEAKTYGVARLVSLRLRAFLQTGEEIVLPAPSLDADGNPYDGSAGEVPCTTTQSAGDLWLVKGYSLMPPLSGPLNVDTIGTTTATLRFSSTRATAPDGRVHQYVVSIEDVATSAQVASAAIPDGVGTFTATGLEPGHQYRALLSASVPETPDYVAQSASFLSTDFATLERPSYPSTWVATGALSLARGSAPLAGSLTGLDLGGASGNGGALTLRLTQVRLTAPGGLPVTASMALVPSGGASFSAGDGAQRTLTQAVRVKLSQAKLFGSIPLVLGTTCQAKAPSTLTLSGELTPGGGTLTGPLTIPALTGCGPFTSVLSSLIAGTTKGVRLTLAPTPPPAPAAS